MYSYIFRYKYSFVSYLYHSSDANIFGCSFVLLFLIRIYSDIRSYHFFDTNIFGYSFFGNKYNQIFIPIENLYLPHPDSDTQLCDTNTAVKKVLWSWT